MGAYAAKGSGAESGRQSRKGQNTFHGNFLLER